MIYLVLIFMGLSLGSFVNALVWRLHEQQQYRRSDGSLKKLSQRDKRRLERLSITKGRSMCSHCGHPLAPADLVPVASWLMLRGKCRYCKQPIPDTPVAELLTAAVLVLSYLLWPYGGAWGLANVMMFGVWSVIVTCFVALMIYDAKWFLLPDKIVWPLAGLATLFLALRSVEAGSVTPFIGGVVGAVVISGTFWLLTYVSRGSWIGFGDVKLGISLGMVAGGALMGWLVIFLASLLGTIVTLPQIMRGAGLKSKLPFGPHLIVATIVVMLCGQAIISWYGGLLAS